MDPFGESGPDEPDEFDPDSLGPDVPEAPDVEPDLETSFENVGEVDDGLFEAFWGAVVFLNVALAALSIGAMLLYFQGDVRNGGGAIVIGLVSAAFAGRYYFGYTRGDENETEGGGDEGTPETDDGGNDAAEADGATETGDVAEADDAAEAVGAAEAIGAAETDTRHDGGGEP